MRTPDFDLQRMIALRVEGWSFSALGREFCRDHTTIMYHCRRHNVVSKIPNPRKSHATEGLTLEERIPWKPKPRPEPKYAGILFEKTNSGKSYKEYLKESMQRPTERRYFKIYYETELTPEDARRKRQASRAAQKAQQARG